MNKTNSDGRKTPIILKSSDVEDLQQKYLSMDIQTNNKSEARQGPAFRALARDLDNDKTNTITTDRHSPPSNLFNSQPKETPTVKGYRYTSNSINMTPEYKIEEPKNYNEFKANVVRSMPKPAPSPTPFNYSQAQAQPQTRPAPFVAPPPPAPVQSKSTAGDKPSFNVNIGSNSRSGNRVFMKGAKGTASLNPNQNINQTATCYACGTTIRGPYVSAIGRCYCVDHFTCSKCSINLTDCGFVEENGKLYCERDFEQYLAPHCAKCSQAILKECVHALEKTWHPECFTCTACKKSIGTGSFHVEEGEPYCIEDYRRMFQAKCTSCDFPVEPGDRYLEAIGGTYHVDCFNCSKCQVNLDGQPFIVKNDRPFCRLHGR